MEINDKNSNGTERAVRNSIVYIARARCLLSIFVIIIKKNPVHVVGYRAGTSIIDCYFGNGVISTRVLSTVHIGAVRPRREIVRRRDASRLAKNVWLSISIELAARFLTSTASKERKDAPRANEPPSREIEMRKRLARIWIRKVRRRRREERRCASRFAENPREYHFAAELKFRQNASLPRMQI